MGKQRNQVTTSSTTPQNKSWIDRYMQQAQDRYISQSGVPTTGPLAQGQAGLTSLAGNLPYGMERGLGGIDAYYNPYEKDVVAGTQADYDRQRGLANVAASDQATKAGAFGGSREAVLRAGLLGDIGRNEASTLANVRNTGFNTAASNLMADRERAANLGLAGTQGLLGYGQYLDSRGANALDQLRGGLSFGGTTTKETIPLRNSPLSGALGGASIGAKFGPWGALGGGLLGGLGSFL